MSDQGAAALLRRQAIWAAVIIALGRVVVALERVARAVIQRAASSAGLVLAEQLATGRRAPPLVALPAGGAVTRGGALTAIAVFTRDIGAAAVAVVAAPHGAPVALRVARWALARGRQSDPEGGDHEVEDDLLRCCEAASTEVLIEMHAHQDQKKGAPVGPTGMLRIKQSLICDRHCLATSYVSFCVLTPACVHALFIPSPCVVACDIHHSLR